jgi:hypothetical protein
MRKGLRGGALGLMEGGVRPRRTITDCPMGENNGRTLRSMLKHTVRLLACNKNFVILRFRFNSLEI